MTVFRALFLVGLLTASTATWCGQGQISQWKEMGEECTGGAPESYLAWRGTSFPHSALCRSEAATIVQRVFGSSDPDFRAGASGDTLVLTDPLFAMPANRQAFNEHARSEFSSLCRFGFSKMSLAASSSELSAADTYDLGCPDAHSKQWKKLDKQAAEFDENVHSICSGRPTWSSSVCVRVALGEVWIGMNLEMLIASVGLPSSSSKTTTADHVDRVCTYSWGATFSSPARTFTVYLEDEVVTTIQE
jgi:hypothetical protein